MRVHGTNPAPLHTRSLYSSQAAASASAGLGASFLSAFLSAALSTFGASAGLGASGAGASGRPHNVEANVGTPRCAFIHATKLPPLSRASARFCPLSSRHDFASSANVATSASSSITGTPPAVRALPSGTLITVSWRPNTNAAKSVGCDITKSAIALLSGAINGYEPASSSNSGHRCGKFRSGSMPPSQSSAMRPSPSVSMPSVQTAYTGTSPNLASGARSSRSSAASAISVGAVHGVEFADARICVISPSPFRSRGRSSSRVPSRSLSCTMPSPE